MRVITTSNYHFKFAEIETALRNAQLISFDTQYSGVVPEFEPKTQSPSFASPDQLYAHIRRSIKKFIIIQFGLTTFTYNNSTNKYTACCYTFYVFPRSVASIKKEFVLGTSAFEFLEHAGFDFNKGVYKGINCLSSVEESILRSDLQSGALLVPGERGLSHEEEVEINKICTKVSLWETRAKEKEKYDLDDVDYSKKLFVYLLNKDIQRRFHRVWTYKTKGDSIIVERVSDLERTALEGQDTMSGGYENDVINHYMGLSRVFKLMTDLRRPIIVNSPLIDLMMVYQQMYKPLPASYAEFKRELNVLFPHIYDVRHIAYELQATHETSGSELATLRSYFIPGQGSALEQCEPRITLSLPTNDMSVETIGQEPGWDSYYTGSCFIRMAHFLAKENGFESAIVRQHDQDLSRRAVLAMLAAGIKQYKNRLHIAPATVSHICLIEADPAPRLPQLLNIAWTLCRPVHMIISDLAQCTRESIRVDMLTKNSARILVNNVAAAKAVGQRFDYTVQGDSNYAEKLAAIGSLVAVTGLGVWMYKRWSLQ